MDSYIKITYEICLQTLNTLKNKDFINKYIFPKIGQCLTIDPLLNNLKALLFSNHNEILKLANQGEVDKVKFDKYLNVKQEFEECVIFLTLFPDANDTDDFLR